MTPGARVAAAITVLDEIIQGAAAEQALTAWARGSRFAGSKDRAAVRDHVYDVLRARRSLGDGSGRSLMQRLAVREEWSLDALFCGEGHAPTTLTASETDALAQPLDLSGAARCDLPDWLWPTWQDSLGDQAEAAALAQQGRADVFLRVNTRKGTAQDAMAVLDAAGVKTAAHASVPGCLRVTENPRRVKLSAAYLDGLVELQDASSQYAVQKVPVPAKARVLDYCAGGGGKALAFADLHDATVFAHDIAPHRMRDLPARMVRSGVDIGMIATRDLVQQAKFDVVFCDAPCSGSGTWRRTPDAKWRLSADGLASLMQSQDEVLKSAASLVSEGGILVYATCSVIREENMGAIERFLKEDPNWKIEEQLQLLPNSDGDGFYLGILAR
jgi:16S rRNA (cytosine967-C5)-methyltransferase